VIFYPEYGNPVVVTMTEMEMRNLRVDELGLMFESAEKRFGKRVVAFIDGVMHLSDGMRIPFNFLRGKSGVEPFFLFYDKLKINADDRVKATLINFLHAYDYEITDDGDLIAYKAVETKVPKKVVDAHLLKLITATRYVESNFVCLFDETVFIDCDTETVFSFIGGERTPGIVRTLAEAYSLKYLKDTVKYVSENDVFYCDIHKGRIIYPKTGTVQVHEYAVDDNPQEECSYGLHVGTLDYARRFCSKESHKVLRCSVNPAHVVSVPCNGTMGKIRVKELTVLGPVDGE
jgi:hypothetical protein